MGFSDAENTIMYLKSSGQRILESSEGLAIFDRILAQNYTQILVLAGQPSRVHRFLGLVKEQPSVTSFAGSGASGGRRIQGQGRRPEMKGFSLEQCLEWDLKQLINRLLKIPRDRIERGKNLAEFGFNSIGLTQLAIQLDQALWYC